jgi:hypothetical protein
VNDNDGKLYEFAPAVRSRRGQTTGAAGLFDLSLLTDKERKERARLWGHEPAGAATEPVAISARRHTDVLVFTLDRIRPGLRISPTTASGRGAWASLGYLIRDTAVKWLDIGPDEIQVGVHPRLRDNVLLGEVFIADTLENGAGYASRLAGRFEALLEEADTHAASLQQHSGQPCDSSCHQCLRDYGNRRWHPLLDWRLAIDLLDLLHDRPLEPDSQRHRDINAATAFANDFGFETVEDGVPIIIGRNGQQLAVRHPFEDPSLESPSPRVHQLRRHHPNASTTSSFELLRRPGTLVAGLM